MSGVMAFSQYGSTRSSVVANDSVSGSSSGESDAYLHCHRVHHDRITSNIMSTTLNNATRSRLVTPMHTAHSRYWHVIKTSKIRSVLVMPTVARVSLQRNYRTQLFAEAVALEPNRKVRRGQTNAQPPLQVLHGLGMAFAFPALVRFAKLYYINKYSECCYTSHQSKASIVCARRTTVFQQRRSEEKKKTSTTSLCRGGRVLW